MDLHASLLTHELEPSCSPSRSLIWFCHPFQHRGHCSADLARSRFPTSIPWKLKKILTGPGSPKLFKIAHSRQMIESACRIQISYTYGPYGFDCGMARRRSSVIEITQGCDENQADSLRIGVRDRHDGLRNSANGPESQDESASSETSPTGAHAVPDENWLVEFLREDRALSLGNETLWQVHSPDTRLHRFVLESLRIAKTPHRDFESAPARISSRAAFNVRKQQSTVTSRVQRAASGDWFKCYSAGS
jgi:hypothetical protein